MSKAQVVSHIADVAGIKKVDAEKAFEAAFEAVQQIVMNGGKIVVRDFGTFKLVKRAERNGRNPKTGDPIHIPARDEVKFAPAR